MVTRHVFSQLLPEKHTLQDVKENMSQTKVLMSFTGNPVFSAQYYCSALAEVELHFENTPLLFKGASAPFKLYEG